jgi:hypothetical protein
MHLCISEKNNITSIITDKAFLVYVNGHHPQTPSQAEIEKLVEKATPEERKLLIPISQMVASYAKAVEQAAVNYQSQK